ncbi:GDYXXLXY domain-containing protein [Kangiella sediminilitoris]|uniref:GDYXXLXY protein n=1 Tax=Kangiella sediminilitoris TaxID=1144748 RepID=A0A1B3B9G9_9GAMM|nr:GDYXXLXY domain-containing protein [Kangiella sediminilitoris]AOE49453.1 hypothetical protein KS2013_729 [Kangiella sediminilitoris]
MKPLKLVILVMFAIQLGVPAYMIYNQHVILSEGTVYKFKTRPIDPRDPFRGQYVTLRYEANQQPIAYPEPLREGETVYAVVSNNKDGFAEINQLLLQPPKSGDYIKTTIRWGTKERGYHISLPFNRYYASEKTAPSIEKAVWSGRRQEVSNVYAEVNVLDGEATLKELYVNELPIREYLERSPSEQN